MKSGLKTLCPLIALALAGCASTPGDVRQSGISETIERPGQLDQVARCVTKGFDEQIRTQNSLRMYPDGSAELVANDDGSINPLVGHYGSSGALYVVEFMSNGESVAVTWYMRGDITFRDKVAERIRGIVNSC